jgi:hypothetical protein
MATSKYFKNYTARNESRVAEDLIIESIKIYGVDVQYMQRTIFNEDILLGADPLSRFTTAVPIEVYFNNTRNLDGEGDFLSKFNLEIRDSLKVTMAKRRWDQFVSEKIVTENDYVLQVETANTLQFNSVDNFMLESGSANGYSLNVTRPKEGDLIFVPFMNYGNGAIYEIKFVEHEDIFYQHGRLYTYVLSCDLFTYSSERLDTGNTAIDDVENRYSSDILNYQIKLEDATALLHEEDGWVLLEFDLVDTVRSANNAIIHTLADDYVDFSERNPFSEVDRY